MVIRNRLFFSRLLTTTRLRDNRCVHTHMYILCIYYTVDDKRGCKAVPRVPIIQRETFALAILLGRDRY